MPGLKYALAVVQAKVQAAEGTGVTPVPELNSILVSDLAWNPNTTIIERPLLRSSLSPIAVRNGRKQAVATFTFELKPGSEIGHRPECSPFLRAAGMSETVTGAVVTSLVSGTYRWTASVAGGSGVFWVELAAGGDPSISDPDAVRENGDDMRRTLKADGTAETSILNIREGEFMYGDFDTLGFSTIYVKLSDSADPDSKAAAYVQSVGSVTNILYNFRDDSFEFATIDIYRAGKKYTCVDSIVDITSMQFNGGGIVTCQARLLADYATPTDVALPTALYQRHLPDIAASMAFTIDGFAAGVIPNWNVNFANQTSERLDVNSANGYKGTSLTGRQPAGSITMEQELVATFPAITRWETAKEMAWSAVLGLTPRRITLSGSSMQFVGEPSETNISNGILGWTLPFRLNESGAAKELTIKQD
jgi:hypothetical protein